MKKYFAIIIVFIWGACVDVFAQENDEIFTIYLVRHSEKDLSSGDYANPPLTPCGEKRSASLSRFFSAVDLEAVYSTSYNRTLSTARPTAQSKDLNIKEYKPYELEEFSEILLQNKQEVLVVGHSNTTAVLAGLLIDETFGEFDLDIYNRIYQVVVYESGGRLHLLHTAFECVD